MEKNNNIIIFTDGACKKNPGPGGWGAVIYTNNKKCFISGGEKNTTNNRMEMIAAIKAIYFIRKQYFNNLENFKNIIIYTDSKYLYLGITKWINKWKKNFWQLSNNKYIKNIDLWKKIDMINSFNYPIIWRWIKSHSNNKGNDIADMLAKKALKENI